MLDFYGTLAQHVVAVEQEHGQPARSVTWTHNRALICGIGERA